jgi:6-pyruvoyltetrahydropterin/6-carboxytetrahydropterin synthase
MFTGLNPSLEHFARIFWESLVARVPLGGRLVTVKLWENEHDWAAYSARPS